MFSHFLPTKPQKLPFSGHGRSRSATRPISPKTAFSGRRVFGQHGRGGGGCPDWRPFSVWYHAVLRGDINYIRVGAHKYSGWRRRHLADEYPAKWGLGHRRPQRRGARMRNRQRMSDWHELYHLGWRSNRGAIRRGRQCFGHRRHTDSPGSLVLGSPAKVVRPLTEGERADLKPWAQKYVDNAAYCLKHNLNIGAPLCTRVE